MSFHKLVAWTNFAELFGLLVQTGELLEAGIEMGDAFETHHQKLTPHFCHLALTMTVPLPSYMRFLAFVAVMHLVTGCNLTTTEYYVYYNQHIELQSHGANKPYEHIRIGEKKNTFNLILKTHPNLMVRMPDGQFVLFGDLSVELLENQSYEIIEENNHKWPNGSRRIKLSPNHFFIVNGQDILFMSADSLHVDQDNNRPAFKLQNSEKEYQLPLSYPQLVELLGKPTRSDSLTHQ